MIRTPTRQSVVLLTEPASHKTIELSGAKCSVIDVDAFRGLALRPDGSIQEGDREFNPASPNTSGKVTFDCTVPTGGRARGSLSFACE